jgi:hypothetical protein
MRNILSFFVQTIYCYFSIKTSPKVRASLNYLSYLADFEVAILGSVLPYIHFKKFVCEDRIRKINYFGHLKIVTTY